MQFATLFAGCACALALSSFAAHAGVPEDGAIIKISAVSSPRLNLYARDALDSKLKDMPKDTVPVPLDVSDVTPDEKFLKVKIDGESVWLNAKQVSVLRAVTAGCLAQANAPKDAAAIRGANNGCVK